MAFLDNSGDIILDAVLTDTGRKRLAQADGSFRITKFALADDEIDYSLYNYNHASGSAYYDLNILQSPVLEAFTNNMSVLKSKLVSYTRNDLLYLPVVKLNDKIVSTVTVVSAGSSDIPNGGYIVTADATTSDLSTYAGLGGGGLASFLGQPDAQGIFRGRGDLIHKSSPLIVDQGLDSADLVVRKLPNGDPLRETQYIVEVDSRLLRLTTPADPGTLARPSYIDDDNIASYYFALNSNSTYFAAPDGTAPANIPPFRLENQGGVNVGDQWSVIGPQTNTGRYGTRFGVQLVSTDDIAWSTELFTTLGGETATGYLGATGMTFYYIDTMLRITGYTTGYRMDIPIRLIKKK